MSLAGVNSTNLRIDIWVMSSCPCLLGLPRPMGVEVHSKDDKEEQRSSSRPSFFGRGMLERARATSLALLGGTTAVGLAMVALALNQGWPLIPGSSVPLISPQHQAVGRATVAAELRSDLRFESAAAADQDGGPVLKGDADSRSVSTSPALSTAPKQSADFVVVPSTPVKSHQGQGQTRDPAEKPQPTQAVQPPQSTAESPAVALPTSSPATPAPSPAVEPSPPDAAVSEAPDDDSDSAVPNWSHGHGYGHDDDWDDDGHDWDDDDSHDWDGGGHGHWHGHHDDD